MLHVCLSEEVNVSLLPFQLSYNCVLALPVMYHEHAKSSQVMICTIRTMSLYLASVNATS